MSTSFRPCLHCDYLLPADAARISCPECGYENDFPEIDADVEAAFAAPMRTILRSCVFSSDLLRNAWRGASCKSETVKRLGTTALLAGLVLPMAMLTASAAIGLKTTVHCTPHAVTKGCEPYLRPPFLEYNWYDWSGWNQYSDQKDKWASRGVLPFEQIDRTLINRSIVLTRAWTFTGSRALVEDLGLIASTVAGSWVLVVVWLALTKYRMHRASTIGDSHAFISPNLRALCYVVLASSGILLAVLIAVELVIRLTVPEFGIGGRGLEWHALRSYLPWAIAIPAVFLWRLSAKGPPGFARWALWPTLAVGAAIASLVRLCRSTASDGPVSIRTDAARW